MKNLVISSFVLICTLTTSLAAHADAIKCSSNKGTFFAELNWIDGGKEARSMYLDIRVAKTYIHMDQELNLDLKKKTIVFKDDEDTLTFQLSQPIGSIDGQQKDVPAIITLNKKSYKATCR